MKKTVSFYIFLLSFLHTSAQEWSVGVGYHYQYSSKWDKAIQTFNFSRPFLEEKQPLLIHGTHLEIGYQFSSEKKFQSGVKISHNFVRSRSENSNFNVTFNLHQLNLAYNLHYAFQNKLEGILLELTPAVFGTRLSRRVNEELDQVDDENNVAYGIGGSLGVTALYKIDIRNEHSLSPFFTINYAPYLYSPKSIAVLNQVTVDEPIQLINLEIGVRFTLKN